MKPFEAREQVVQALTGLHKNVSVYTGAVPDRVPTFTDGSIKPYIAVWVTNSVGDRGMTALDSLADVDATRLTIQTQIVGATPNDVYLVADLVRETLTNRRIGAGIVLPDFEQQAYSFVLTDTTTAANNQYLPLFWNLTTQ